MTLSSGLCLLILKILSSVGSKPLTYMVQIPAQRTPECQGDVPSQGEQQREERRVVHQSVIVV